MSTIVEERPIEVTERVRRFGGPLAHAILDPACGIFEADGIAGAVAFDVIGKCAVAFGDPICERADRDVLRAAFEAYCRRHGWSSINVAATTPNSASVTFADLLFADPRHDPSSGPRGRHLRQNVRHAARAGVTASEYTGPRDAELEARVQAACERWREARGASLFITEPRLFTERIGRRWFIARCGDEVVGLLSLLHAGDVGGNLVNLVFATPAAPAHTTDLLVVEALRALREEGAESVCFGIGPRVDIALDGFGVATAALAKGVYHFGDRLVHFKAKTAFWEKFGPLRREPLYIRFDPPRIGVRACRALFRAFHFTL